MAKALYISNKANPGGNAYFGWLELYRHGYLPSTPGTVSVLKVEHDDWCPGIYDGLCICAPAFSITATVS